MLLSFFYNILQIDTFDGLSFQLLQIVSVHSDGIMVNYTGAKFDALQELLFNWSLSTVSLENNA